jgi:hypothetical protein
LERVSFEWPHFRSDSVRQLDRIKLTRSYVRIDM